MYVGIGKNTVQLSLSLHGELAPSRHENPQVLKFLIWNVIIFAYNPCTSSLKLSIISRLLIIPNKHKSYVNSCSVQSLSRVWLFATPWTAAHQVTNSRSLLKLMSIESVMPSNHLLLCCPLLLLPPIPPSIRVFSNESTLRMRWPKYWSFSFSISPSNEHPGLIFRMDWLGLLAVQGALKSLLQHHSSKASVLRHSAFFTVQLSYPYTTAGKTIALTRQTFVGKVTSLLFNMLSRLAITFLLEKPAFRSGSNS